MLEAVLFDLDGTLYDRDRLVAALVDDQYDAFARELDGVPRSRFVGAVLEMDEHGYGEKATGYARVARDLGLPSPLAARLLEHFWARYDDFCELGQDTRLALHGLRAAGLKLGIVTNGSVARQQRKIDALGVAEWFDAILISAAEGLRKPDPAIFRRAAARCGVEPRRAAFVGDHPQVDVDGARNAGLVAIWKAVPYWPAPPDVPVAERLTDVVSICRELGLRSA